MGWQDALDVQIDIHNFLASDAGERFSIGWLAATEHERRTRGAPRPEDDIAGVARWWARTEAARVFNAEPVWIEPDMMTVVEAAIGGFNPEPLIEEDLITRNGLIILPRPLPIVPEPGETRIRPDGSVVPAATLAWSVAAWQAEGSHLILTLYHDHDVPDGLDAQDPAAAREARKVSRWVPTHTVVWDIGAMIPEGLPNRGHLKVQTQVQAIWRLLNQTMAVRTRERPPRSFLKRAARLDMGHEHVTVVRLRRPAGPEHEVEHEGVAWSHRWIVAGHWRRQWYRSIGVVRVADLVRLRERRSPLDAALARAEAQLPSGFGLALTTTPAGTKRFDGGPIGRYSARLWRSGAVQISEDHDDPAVALDSLAARMRGMGA